MNTISAPRLDLAVFVLFALALLLVLPLHLLPSLLAGLLVYALVGALVPRLGLPMLGHEGARLAAVTLIAIVVITLVALAMGGLVSFLRHSGESLPLLAHRMAEIIDNSRDSLPSWLIAYMPADADALRAAAVTWLKENAAFFQVAGTGFGVALVHILLGMVIGALLSLEAASSQGRARPLSASLAERARRLGDAFRRVVFAQFWISTINTMLTAVFLVFVLPLLDVELPFTKTLILVTFIAGLIPILGNLISNTVICIVGLSQSLFVAFGVLLYLMLIHKLEYFLNARIVGSHIKARAWEILIAMLVMEAAFGIPGLIAAPIYYAYLKQELASRELI
ncbi:MAG TPA: AI-2E family transporter [Pseudomonadales bacterium]|nr:AI-2E family transporter [Pseudomonadales bacterium]HNC70618.1 AI-2E family transporter [Pseudomonadales bacterium]